MYGCTILYDAQNSVNTEIVFFNCLSPGSLSVHGLLCTS